MRIPVISGFLAERKKDRIKSILVSYYFPNRHYQRLLDGCHETFEGDVRRSVSKIHGYGTDWFKGDPKRYKELPEFHAEYQLWHYREGLRYALNSIMDQLDAQGRLNYEDAKAELEHYLSRCERRIIIDVHTEHDPGGYRDHGVMAVEGEPYPAPESDFVTTRAISLPYIAYWQNPPIALSGSSQT